MRIHVKPGNLKIYSAAFHDDTCLECRDAIMEGDPIGYVKGDGPYCYDCAKDIGVKTEIQVMK
jgi:hypothetical protein